MWRAVALSRVRRSTLMRCAPNAVATGSPTCPSGWLHTARSNAGTMRPRSNVPSCPDESRVDVSCDSVRAISSNDAPRTIESRRARARAMISAESSGVGTFTIARNDTRARAALENSSRCSS